MVKAQLNGTIKDGLSSTFPGMPFLAFGLWLAWAQLTFGAAVWISDVELSALVITGMQTTRNITQSLVLLAASLLWFKVGRYFDDRVVFGAGIIGALGALLIIFCGPFYFLYDPYAVYFGPVSLVMLGIGSGIIALRCIELYAVLPPRKSLLYVALSVLESILIYFLIVHAPSWTLIAGGPSIIETVAFVGLPILAAYLATMPTKDKRRNIDAILPGLKALSPSFWKLVIVCVALACIANMLTASVFAKITPTDSIAGNDIRMLLQLIFVITLLVFAIHIDASRFNPGKIYSIIAISLVLLIAFIPLLGGETSGWSALLAFLTDAFMLLLWLLLAFVSFQKKHHPVLMFGLAFGVFTLGGSLGWYAGSNIPALFGSDIDPVPFYLILAGIVLILMFALFTEKSLDRLFSPSSDQELPLQDLLKESIRDESDHRQKGHFVELIERVATSNRLSRRETEVLRYLAMGRNSNFIASSMNISLNTARVHVRNIYTKLDVHTRQDLINLVDSYAQR